MTLARRYIISGMVQGVGFRYFVLRRARERVLQGWVRNVTDGSVEVLAEGRPEALEEFEADLREGPRHAHVTSVSVQEETPRGGHGGFEIR